MSLLSPLGKDIVLYAGYLALFASVFILARIFLSEEERSAAEDNLGDLRNRKASNKLVKVTRPFFSQYIVPVVRGKKFWSKKQTDYRRKLISAGLKEELTPDEFISFKIFLVVFFPLVALVTNTLGLTHLAWYAVIGSGILGFFYPNFWVDQLIKKRQEKILKSMPFIVDLLALSTEAGLDFVGAIQKVVDKAASSPLVDEFDQMLKEIKVGASRSEALREMGVRVGMTEVNSFVAILISADQMGASIGKILKQQSAQIRTERLVRAEKLGAKAASRVLLPTVLFILPAVLLMIFGPYIAMMF